MTRCRRTTRTACRRGTRGTTPSMRSTWRPQPGRTCGRTAPARRRSPAHSSLRTSSPRAAPSRAPRGVARTSGRVRSPRPRTSACRGGRRPPYHRGRRARKAPLRTRGAARLGCRSPLRGRRVLSGKARRAGAVLRAGRAHVPCFGDSDTPEHRLQSVARQHVRSTSPAAARRQLSAAASAAVEAQAAQSLWGARV